MTYQFDTIVDRSNNHSAKYDERKKKFGTDDVIPLWIADMDLEKLADMAGRNMKFAATVQDKSWDGRFSSSNKDWAFSVSLPQGLLDGGMDRRHDYAVSAHPAILDGFIWQVRKEIREREHPQTRTDARPPLIPAAKEIKKKALDMER